VQHLQTRLLAGNQFILVLEGGLDPACISVSLRNATTVKVCLRRDQLPQLMKACAAQSAPLAYQEEVEGFCLHFEVQLPKAVQPDIAGMQLVDDFMLWRFTRIKK
jgi:hypothetical protein